GVAADDHRTPAPVLDQPGRHTGRGPPYEGPVHAVGAGPEGASQTGRAELQPLAEPVVQAGAVPGCDEGVDLGSGLGVGVVVPPGPGRQHQGVAALILAHRRATTWASRSPIA